MENAKASTENGPQHENPDNFYVDLNNPELIQTVREFKDELQNVKQDNQRILELNEFFFDKMNKQEKDKRSVIETDSEYTSYKHKGRRSKYADNESSSEIKPRSRRDRQRYISHSTDNDQQPRKKKYKPYEDISGEFKKIKPPMFNGEAEKGEEAEAWLSGMKKYLQIYNYSERLKFRMTIYNLTGKADIWWQYIKRVMLDTERGGE